MTISPLPAGDATIGVPALDPIAADDQQPYRDRLLTHKLGVMGPLFLLYALAGAIPAAATSTLVQALFAQLDGANKVALAGMTATLASLAGALSVIVAGALSDRTRSRFGRRKPWILGGALVAAGSLSLNVVTTNLVAIIVLFALFQAGLNAAGAATSALMPDRVGRNLLGRLSALFALGNLSGTAIGGFAAAGFISVPSLGLAVVPWSLVIAAVLICVFLPSHSNRDQPREPFSVGSLLASMRPPADRDFWLAFVGRFMFLLALLVVMAYQLFLLTDYFEVPTETAAQTIAIGGVILALGAGICAVVTGGLSDRVGRRKPFVLGAGVVMALAIATLVTAHDTRGFFIFVAIASTAFGTFIAVDQALMVEVLPDHENSARDLGFLSAANTTPGLVGPGVAAVLVTSFGYPAIFVAGMVFAIVSVICLALIRRVR